MPFRLNAHPKRLLRAPLFLGRLAVGSFGFEPAGTWTAHIPHSRNVTEITRKRQNIRSSGAAQFHPPPAARLDLAGLHPEAENPALLQQFHDRAGQIGCFAHFILCNNSLQAEQFSFTTPPCEYTWLAM